MTVPNIQIDYSHCPHFLLLLVLGAIRSGGRRGRPGPRSGTDGNCNCPTICFGSSITSSAGQRE